jgi:RNA polymerase sigma factor (sigma-70 family)
MRTRAAAGCHLVDPTVCLPLSWATVAIPEAVDHHGTRPLDEGKLSPSDAELIERCLRKDNSAWEPIVARYRRKVFHIAYKFTGKHDEAEDLTQEIFLKVFRSLDKFNRDADFSTWLSSVARNFCIDNYRAGKREREVLVEDLVAFDLAPAVSGNPHRALEDQDRRSFLRRGLDQLPDKLREAVVLRDLQGLSYQEMADRLGLPEGTVKSRINRGREELARLLLRAHQPGRGGRRRGRLPRTLAD